MNRRQIIALLFVVAVPLAVVVAAPAPAAAAAQTAKHQQIAAQAKKAYDEAQYDKAADLYLAALRADPSQVAYLYAAARAAQQGGRLDRAEELYLKAIAEPGLAPELREKSKVYLDGIATARAEARAQEAETLQKAAKYADAADVWRSAAALQPARAIYLCRAGRAAKLAGDKAAALRDYQACRAKAPAGTADYAEAVRVLQELETASKPVEPTPVAPPPKVEPKAAPLPVAPTPVAAAIVEPRPIAVVRLPAATSPTWTSWAAVGGGAALLALGASAVVWAHSDDTDLFAKIDARVNGKVAQISYDDAAAQKQSINVRYGIGWSAIGLGAVAAGFGTWMLVKHGNRGVAVLPQADGVRFAVRF